MFSFFKQISEIKNIVRWGSKFCVEPENVKEHSYDVAVLAHLFATTYNSNEKLSNGNLVDANKCSVMALFHDVTESITGDLPTPVKYLNPDIQVSYKKVEEIAAHQIIDLLPDTIASHYKEYLLEDAGSNIEHRIVKAADIASAYIKCITEISRGNSDFHAVRTNLDQIIETFDFILLTAFCDSVKGKLLTR